MEDIKTNQVRCRDSLMKLDKLTSKLKKRYTEDWLQAFPEFEVYRPMWLMKRNGPILVGICLERYASNDAYRPIVHVHNLLRSSGFISLSMSFRLFERIGFGTLQLSTRDHEKKLEMATSKVREQARIPLDEDLSVDALIIAYNEYICSLEGAIEGPLSYWLDIVCLLIWCGRTDEARRKIIQVESESTVLSPQHFVHYDGRGSYFSRLYEMVERPGDLREVVSREVFSLGLEAIPDYGLQCDLSSNR